MNGHGTLNETLQEETTKWRLEQIRIDFEVHLHTHISLYCSV